MDADSSGARDGVARLSGRPLRGIELPVRSREKCELGAGPVPLQHVTCGHDTVNLSRRFQGAMNYGETVQQSADTLYSDQLRRGFKRLRFIDFLEEEFRETYQSENGEKSRLTIVLALVICVVVTVISQAVGGEGESAMRALGLAVLVPMLLLTLVASYRATRIAYQFLLGVSALVIGLAGAVVDVKASLSGMSYYFAAQASWIFMIWLVMGFVFRPAAYLAWAVSIAYVAAALSAGLPTEEIIFEMSMLLTVNLLGGYSCYKIEYAARVNFLESKLLNQLAQRDGLTGLFNRRSFDEYVDRIWRQSRREGVTVAFLLVDIDYFKSFNDVYGHQAGDDALKDVAKVLAEAGHRPLDLVARYGGEEFALLLYGPSREYSRELPESLLKNVQGREIVHEGSENSKYLSISIGVAIIHPDAERSVTGAIQMADEALYQAKENGRNRVVMAESGTTNVETGRFRSLSVS
ncbi:MAG: diguanylate cyclase [Gammaproteobacteria bacterium]